MTKPSLLILAAGMGSRFGGLKQLAPLGPNNETIIEYSVFDAIRAGFEKVVFVIRHSFEKEFKELYLPKFRDKIHIEFAFQELDMLPDGFCVPEGREKPWGTGHAIYMAKELINEPFAMINADDFYGFHAYEKMAKFLINSKKDQDYSMVGYHLKNTLSDFGSVSRGVCESNNQSLLMDINERTHIERKGSEILYTDDHGKNVTLDETSIVSMNFWGFQPNLFDEIEVQFIEFLKKSGKDIKSEFYIPSVIFRLIKEGKIEVSILEANSTWFGVTYPQDKDIVKEKMQELVKAGEYPGNLWD